MVFNDFFVYCKYTTSIINIIFDKVCFCQLCSQNSERRGDWIQIAVSKMFCIFETLLALQAGFNSSERLVSAIHMHTQKNPLYHTEYVIVIQHEDASKPLFQNALLFKASENSGATYWGVEHHWFSKSSEYHSLGCFLVHLYFFHWRTLSG